MSANEYHPLVPALCHVYSYIVTYPDNSMFVFLANQLSIAAYIHNSGFEQRERQYTQSSWTRLDNTCWLVRTKRPSRTPSKPTWLGIYLKSMLQYEKSQLWLQTIVRVLQNFYVVCSIDCTYKRPRVATMGPNIKLTLELQARLVGMLFLDDRPTCAWHIESSSTTKCPTSLICYLNWVL